VVAQEETDIALAAIDEISRARLPLVDWSTEFVGKPLVRVGELEVTFTQVTRSVFRQMSVLVRAFTIRQGSGNLMWHFTSSLKEGMFESLLQT
jgi:hypothetical protein